VGQQFSFGRQVLVKQRFIECAQLAGLTQLCIEIPLDAQAKLGRPKAFGRFDQPALRWRCRQAIADRGR
jgi:hypothetical protein